MANDVIAYDEYQKLPEEEKQNWETNWNSDGKSGTARRKGAKLAEAKPIVPTNEINQAEPETNKTSKALSRFESDLETGKFDAKDVNGNYAYSFDELVKYRDKYRAEGNEVWKKFQEEINRRPEGQAQIAANKKAAADAEAKRKAEEEANAEAKRKAEEEAAKKKEEELKTGGSKGNAESALKDTKAEDEALEKKQEALDKVLDKAKTSRAELDEEWDELLKKNEAELDKHKDAADLADFLPRFAIQHYLEGNFGEKRSAKALGTLGYFLLDKIGAAMVNASQVARGMSPTQKTALEQYNTKMMEAAINRDDRNRSKINEEKVNTIIKNSDA